MVNINVIGRLGADSEIKDGKMGRFVSLNLAVDDWANGEKTTSWFAVTFPGEQAVKLKEYLTKGKLVNVIGTEHVRSYTAKDGSTQFSRDIVAYAVNFISVGRSQQGDTTDASKTADTGKLSKPSTPAPAAVAAQFSDTKDDLPF